MQLTIGRKQQGCSLSVQAKKVGLRRLYRLLVALTVVPPIVWGLGVRAAQAEEREVRLMGDAGESAAPQIGTLRELAAVSEDLGLAARRSAADMAAVSALTAAPGPAEVYSSVSRDLALRAARIRAAELALAAFQPTRGERHLAASENNEPTELLLLAQADAPLPDASPAKPADEDADENDEDAVVDLSTLTPARVVAPQLSTGGAAFESSPFGTSARGAESATGGESATTTPSRRTIAPESNAAPNLGGADQPASEGPSREADSTESSPVGATEETRRRAHTALHSAAAQAAVSMVSDSPYRNALSGQERYFEPSSDFTSIDDTLTRASETLSIIPGFYLQNVTFFGGYSSNGIASQRNIMTSLGSDYDYGAAGTVGYLRNFQRSNFRFGYTPSHSRRARFSEWNTTDHRMRFNAGHQLSRRWTLGGSASVNNSGMEAFWIETPLFSTVENRPTSFDELYRMVEAGELTDDEFASILTGSPVVEEEGGSGLDLSRLLNVSASTNARYAYSPRLSFAFSGAVNDTRLLDDPSIGRRVSRMGLGRIQNLRRVSTNGSMRYALNRRTNLSVGHTRAQMLSTFRSNEMQQSTVSVSQRLGRSWNYGGGIGVGTISVGELRNESFDGTQLGLPMRGFSSWTANGNLSYRLRQHRFRVQASRMVGDSFGLGARHTTRGSAGWGWMSRDSLWSTNATAAYSKGNIGFVGIGENNLIMKTVGFAVSRRVTATSALQTSYYFGQFESPFRGLFFNNSIHRMQASFIWSPAQLR